MRLRNGRRWAAGVACLAMVFGSATAIGTGVTAVAAPVADRGDLAGDALRGWLRTADPVVLDDAVRRAHRTAKDRASAAPDRPGSASIVFGRGMTSADVAGFVARHDVNLYAVEVKVTAADTGDVHTMWFNDVARVPGTALQQLDRSLGAARLRYFQQAEAASSDERAGLRDLAEGDYRVYRAEVVATNARLAALVGAPEVRAVLPDADDSRVTELGKAQQAVREVGATASGEVRLEPGASAAMAAGAPVLTSSGRGCRWKDAGVLACAAGDGTVSGDRAVDAALPRTGAVAGSNESTPSQQPVRASDDDAAFWTACNGTLFPETCPNDSTYRPHADTGGYEAFGVNIANYSKGTTIYICYAQWVSDNDPNGPGGRWVYSCYPYAVITADFTFGAARWDSRWGTRTTVVAGENRYISTLAYKSAPGLATCVVEQSLATAECSRSVQNSVWVPRTGMEDELLIDNPACEPRLLLGRSGQPDDRDRGCFYPSYATSTLPAAFLDTTYGDGQAYNLAVGSSSPASLVEGRTYSSYAEFWAYRQNDMIGKRAWHSVAVDSRVDDALICRTQGNTDPFCYFPVDASRVSPIREFRPV